MSAGAAELEQTLGEGPSRDAFDAGRPVLVDDLDDPARVTWVAFSKAAVDGIITVHVMLLTPAPTYVHWR